MNRSTLQQWIIFLLTVMMVVSLGCKKKGEGIVIIPDAQKNHLQKSRLKGNVKTIQTETYNSSHVDSLDQDFLAKTVIQEYSYDGLLTKVVTLNQLSDTVSIRDIHYNPEGKQLYWIETNLEKKQVHRCDMVYDMNGYLSKERFTSQDSLWYEIDYKTDAIGGVIEMIRHYPEYSTRWLIEYNEHGLTSRMNEFDPRGNLFKYIVVEYDNYGDEVNRKVYRKDGKMIEYTYTQYDPYGKQLKEIFENYVHMIKEIKTYPEHDQKGNWLLEISASEVDTVYFRKREINYY